MSSPRAISFSTSTPAGSRSSSAAAARGDARLPMKPSGVSWLGDIPAEWRIERIKWVADLIVDRAASSQCYIGLENIESGSGRFIATQPNVTEGAAIAIKPNDVLFGKLRPYLAKCHLAEWEGCCSSEFLVLRANKCNPRFLQYSLLSPAFLDYVNMSTYGTKMPRANWKIVGGACMSFPPLPEQRVIAAFLDEKCEAIDVLVDEVKASLAEYADWKRSIIFHAVTKGIPADGGGRPSSAAAARGDARPPKDSGVDIVGEIPWNWKMRRLRFLCSVMTGDQDTQDADPDGAYPFFVRSPIVECSNRYSFDGEAVLMAGDGAGAGKVFHLAKGKMAIHQRVYCFHDFKDIRPAFFYYFMQNRFGTEIDKGSAKSTVPSVRLPMLLDFRICLPCLEEQDAIVAWLDEKCAAIDALVEEKKSLLDDLAAYKKSLIYETVTGKRKVS